MGLAFLWCDGSFLLHMRLHEITTLKNSLNTQTHACTHMSVCSTGWKCHHRTKTKRKNEWMNERKILRWKCYVTHIQCTKIYIPCCSRFHHEIRLNLLEPIHPHGCSMLCWKYMCVCVTELWHHPPFKPCTSTTFKPPAKKDFKVPCVENHNQLLFCRNIKQ